MTNGSALQDGIKLLKKYPGIGSGVHLCLAGERPVLPKEKIPSIAGSEGFLCKDYRDFIFRAFKKRIDFFEVESELEAQIKIAFDAFRTPTHLDSHQYLHLLPSVFRIVVKLAKKYRIKWIRHPFQNESIKPLSFSSYIKKIGLVVTSDYQRSVLKKNHIFYPDYSYGIMKSGHLRESDLIRLLRNLPLGVNDIVCHPGLNPENDKYKSWHYRWEEEKDALKSESVRCLIKELNIKIINYAH
jgi:chitin disaccharide deacetylase